MPLLHRNIFQLMFISAFLEDLRRMLLFIVSKNITQSWLQYCSSHPKTSCGVKRAFEFSFRMCLDGSTTSAFISLIVSVMSDMEAAVALISVNFLSSDSSLKLAPSVSIIDGSIFLADLICLYHISVMGLATGVFSLILEFVNFCSRYLLDDGFVLPYTLPNPFLILQRYLYCHSGLS